VASLSRAHQLFLVHEDSASEVQVLNPHASKRLVAICASGGRVLNLLQDGAKEVGRWT